ncbi:MAG TPA: DUF169 domain-containing protein [Pyrinomonadaceae bacterium]|nr:DUF169 domain-containing protein [Pyrinomonadaceae bacterium]
MDLKTQGNKLRELLGLEYAPVAVSFRPTAPEGVERVEASGPSSCSYWKLAAEGRTFYTEAADHLNCTIGAHTHNVEMPPEKAAELQSMVGEMVKLNYIRMEEVPGIPKRDAPFGVAVYSPLADATEPPDAVIVRGNARQTMLLTEAATRANIGNGPAAMGRPTCAMIPAAMQSEQGVSSLGCIGNRVYTGLSEDELYYTVPGPKLPELVDSLETICDANRALETFHREHAAAVAAAQ